MILCLEGSDASEVDVELDLQGFTRLGVSPLPPLLPVHLDGILNPQKLETKSLQLLSSCLMAAAATLVSTQHLMFHQCMPCKHCAQLFTVSIRGFSQWMLS